MCMLFDAQAWRKRNHSVLIQCDSLLHFGAGTLKLSGKICASGHGKILNLALSMSFCPWLLVNAFAVANACLTTSTQVDVDGANTDMHNERILLKCAFVSCMLNNTRTTSRQTIWRGGNVN